MSRRLEMNAEEAESTSCGWEIIAETRRSLEPSSLLPKRDLSLGFLLFSPCSPHRLPPWVTASGAPRHHVNPCTTAAGTEAGPRALWGCAEGGRRGSPNWGAGTSRRPEGRVQGVSCEMRNRFLSIYFNSVEIRLTAAYIGMTAVISLHGFSLCCFLSINTRS